MGDQPCHQVATRSTIRADEVNISCIKARGHTERHRRTQHVARKECHISVSVYRGGYSWSVLDIGAVQVDGREDSGQERWECRCNVYGYPIWYCSSLR